MVDILLLKRWVQHAGVGGEFDASGQTYSLLFIAITIEHVQLKLNRLPAFLSSILRAKSFTTGH
jgi:hypothetical protein